MTDVLIEKTPSSVPAPGQDSGAGVERATTQERAVARIELDAARCTGLGLCESFAPDFFEVQDDGSLLLLSDVVPADSLTRVEEAVRSCPTEALRVVRS